MGVFSLTFLLALGLTRGESRVIQTVAGSGDAGFSGDGGAALQARLGTIQGLANDAAGNIYIADMSNHVIRRVNSAGNISTVAGMGPDQAGFNGDNQPAIQAKLATPSDVATDDAGNLYVADNGNHRIRRIDRNGMISTVAGTGEPGSSGDGGLATDASLRYPSAIALDSVGNLYIGDVGNYRVRRVAKASGIISTIAGGSFGFAGDGGPATAAAFKNLSALAVGPSGDVFIADSYNNRVRRIGPDGIITTIAGNGNYNVFSEAELGDGDSATKAIVRWPFGLALDKAGNLYIAENRSNRVRRVDSSGAITTVAGSGHPLEPGSSGDGGPADKAKLNGPSGLAIDSLGNIYISDVGNFRVRKVNAQ